jgi:hypothetical protein
MIKSEDKNPRRVSSFVGNRSDKQVRLNIDGCDVKVNFLSKPVAGDRAKLDTLKRMILGGVTRE